MRYCFRFSSLAQLKDVKRFNSANYMNQQQNARTDLFNWPLVRNLLLSLQAIVLVSCCPQ